MAFAVMAITGIACSVMREIPCEGFLLPWRYTMQQLIRETIMGGKTSRDWDEGEMLAQWKGLETGPRFEEGVWRRIRKAEARPLTLRDYVEGWLLPQPIWLSAAAALLVVLAGLGAGMAIPHVNPNQVSSSPVLAQSLGNSYLAMVTGGVK